MKQRVLSYIKITYFEWRIQRCICLVGSVCIYGVMINILMVGVYLNKRIVMRFKILKKFSASNYKIISIHAQHAFLGRFRDECYVRYYYRRLLS